MMRVIWTLVLLLAACPAYADIPKCLIHRDASAPDYIWPAVDMDGDGVYDRIDHCPSTPKGCQVDAWGCSMDSDRDGVCDGLDQCPDTPDGERVNAVGCSASQLAGSARPPVEERRPEQVPPQPPVQPQPVAPQRSEAERQLVEKGVLRLENVYFETGSSRLKPESEAALNEAGAALEKYPDLRIEVQGHTDTRGAAAYNLKLSQQRAESVRAWLLDHYRLRAENVIARGYGETEPETRERNAEELQRNRRVVLKVLNPEALPKNVEIRK